MNLVPINLSTGNGYEYFLDIVNYFQKYKDVLTDDYWNLDDIYSEVIKLINENENWFFVFEEDREFAGLAWVRSWYGGNGKHHSCQLNGGNVRKYSKHTPEAFEGLLSLLFSLGLERVEMEIPEHNLLSQRFALKMGFKKESIIENASKKNNQNINHIRFRLLKGEFING